MDYNNNRLPGHSGPGGLLLSCGKKKQKIKNVFRTAKKPCTHRALKADDGNRTRLPSLGSWCSTDELHLHNTDIIPHLPDISSRFYKIWKFFYMFSYIRPAISTIPCLKSFWYAPPWGSQIPPQACLPPQYTLHP